MHREDDVLLSVAEAAALLDVDRTTVWRYIKLAEEGGDGLPAHKAGHAYTVWQSDAEAFKPRAKRRRGPKPKGS